MADRRDDKHRSRRLPGRTGQPPHPARNTFRLYRALNTFGGKTLTEERTSITFPNCEGGSTHGQLPDPDSSGYRSEHPSLLGDSSSLFSINTFGDPPPSAPEESKCFQLDSTEFTESIKKAGGLKLSNPKSSTLEIGTGKGTASIPFVFEPPPATMVVEREPPKPASQPSASPPSFKNPNQPEFGKPSHLHSRLQPNNNVFNIPKYNQPRPEHHRPAHAPESHLQPVKDFAHKVANSLYPHRPTQPTHDHNMGRAFVITQPINPPVFNTYPQAAPTFSAVNVEEPSYRAPFNHSYYNPIDLTRSDPALEDDRFGAADPFLYVDPNKANENIKALLEGALEDEEDKPRTRGRKKKVDSAIDNLSDKLNHLGVKSEENGRNEESEDEDEDADDGSIEGLKVKLLPHQVEGVEWMRDKEAGVKKKNAVLPKGGILADDMGLGKTIQSIALILTNPRPPLSSSTAVTDKKSLSASVGKSTLVVAPLALIKQWEAEIKDRVLESHKLRVCVHHGPQRTKRFEDLKKYDVVITTYQILVSEHGSSSKKEDGPQVGCFGLHWYRLILDEAHTIKNRNAKATKAACSLRSEYRWCLTGTPMQNNLDELQSLIHFLRIRPYNDLHTWKDQITRPMSQGRGGVAIKRLQYYLKAFMKRRTKEVLKQEGALNPGGKADAKDSTTGGFKITARKVETVIAEFSDEERGFYDRLEQRTDQSLERMMDDEKMNYASALVLLLRLRQACNHPKLVGGSIAMDKDELTTGHGQGSQSPRKSKVVDQDVDEMADLLGGLSVQTTQCGTCLKDLTRDEVSALKKRCVDCEADIAGLSVGKKPKKSKHKNDHISEGIQPGRLDQRKNRQNQFVVQDSDDEEGEGDWLVPEDGRTTLGLGRAGGTVDEDAEGGGESLASSDTETGDESDIKVLGSRDKVINLHTSEEGSRLKAEDSDTSSSKEETDNSMLPTPMTSAKIRHLVKILKRETPNHKTIVFSQFTSMLDLIEPHLLSSRLKYTRYDGSMRNDAREASLERLRNQRSCRVLLCSLKCGSLGLNLTAASRVVILEPFWNPFVEEQAIDRVHRLNQTKDVVVYKLTIQKTVEERILELQEKKRALANAAIEGKDKLGKLSFKDILTLFGRDAEHNSSHDIDVGLGTKSRVLNAHDMSDIRQVGLSGISSRRVTPPVSERGKGVVKEDSIYSRRW